MRVGVKLWQLTVENVWRIPNVCWKDPSVCYTERPIVSMIVLIIATQRGSVFISEANGQGVWPGSRRWLSWWCLPLHYFWKTANTSVLKLFVSNLFAYTVCFVQWGGINKLHLQLNLYAHTSCSCWDALVLCVCMQLFLERVSRE